MASEPGATDLAARLASLSLFAGLDGPTLGALAAASSRRSLTAGEVAFVEGEPSAGLWVLESGWVRAARTSLQGREQVLQFIGPGEPFNTVAVFSAHANPATATALEPSVAWVLPRAAVQRLLRERPEFAARVLENMADRLVYLVGLVADLSLRPVTARLARLLLERADANVLVRPRWFTLAELAARLGTVPDVIQRAMGQLQSEGIVDVSRRQIRILDEARLRALAD